MRKFKILLILIIYSNYGFSQEKWFTLYTDSIALVRDANVISNKFIANVKKIDPNIYFDVKTVIHTTPSLIYYDETEKTINLPLWNQVISEQQKFFYEISGSEIEGKKTFGYFFNGFYLPHELGHALQKIIQGNLNNSYESEYFANTVAILWWRKNGREKELKQCYESAKMIWQKLPNPLPDGVTLEEYFLKNYNEATQNPYTYGYMQFKQFILIYEDKNLPDFNTFIKQYLDKK